MVRFYVRNQGFKHLIKLYYKCPAHSTVCLKGHSVFQKGRSFFFRILSDLIKSNQQAVSRYATFYQETRNQNKPKTTETGIENQINLFFYI